MKITKTLTAMAVALAATTGSAAMALDELVVGYFLEWPTANQFAQANDLYDEALGIPVKWVSFDAGTAMSAAMASGDVHISYSQGVTPFLVATAAGQDLQVIDIAETYSDNNNCVVRSTLEIDKDNAMELKGKQVALPLGTAAHSDFQAQIAHFGLAESDFKIVDMTPVDSAAAFATGEFDMVCGWGGPLRRMKEHGNVILSGADKEAVSGVIYDVTSTPSSFAEANAEIVAKFLGVTSKMNEMYAENRDPMIADIAKEAGMDIEGTTAILDVMNFMSAETQLSDQWMGKWLAGDLKRQADALEAAGTIEKALADYAPLVNTTYLASAVAMAK
jgi:taurine transport system substrate-binding protein